MHDCTCIHAHDQKATHQLARDMMNRFIRYRSDSGESGTRTTDALVAEAHILAAAVLIQRALVTTVHAVLRTASLAALIALAALTVFAARISHEPTYCAQMRSIENVRAIHVVRAFGMHADVSSKQDKLVNVWHLSRCLLMNRCELEDAHLSTLPRAREWSPQPGFPGKGDHRSTGASSYSWSQHLRRYLQERTLITHRCCAECSRATCDQLAPTRRSAAATPTELSVQAPCGSEVS